MKKKLILLLGLLVFICCKKADGSATAAPDHAKDSLEIVKKLTANNEWRLTGEIVMLGTACKNGEYMTFKDSTLVHTICVNGELQTSTENWSLTRENETWKIKIKDSAYFVKFVADTLVLVNMTPNVKDDTVQKEFF